MNDDSALILDGVFYRVPSLDILQGAHLKAHAGAITGLFGRNGSGKTTLLKVAAGQIQPNSGLTIIDGTRLHKQSKWKRFSKVACLPQESMPPPDVTVRTLSGGERRLLEVAIVLGLERDYALLDAPFTGVEPLLIDAIGGRIEEAAAQGTGVLLTDHCHQHVMPLADDAHVLWQKQCVPPDSDAPSTTSAWRWAISEPTRPPARGRVRQGRPGDLPATPGLGHPANASSPPSYHRYQFFRPSRLPVMDTDGCPHEGDAETRLINTRMALCRCGPSESTPFCDEGHTEVGFEAG